MIKILDSDLNLVAFITDYWNDTIHEGINREYVFSCTMVMDEKSEYVIDGNIVEVEDQYFNIVHYRSFRSGEGELLVQIDCEQVGYDLIEDTLDDFIQAGTPADVLALILSGTNFTIGTVEPTDVISVDISEVTNKRAALINLASLSGELVFNKYEISLYTQRGQNRGVQFRIGKNLAGIIKDVDRRSGVVQTAYDIDVIELNSLEGYEGLEYFELGDTVKIIDDEIGINENQRIVEYDYSPKQRINSKVIIANFIDGIQDTITRIQTTTLVKDRLYYGTRFGPLIGFESIRSDKRARGIFNADTFALQTGDGSGSSWTDAVYFDTDDEIYKFTGIVQASRFLGGDIAIGSSNDIFKADSNGIYLGHATFGSAPFRVNMAGQLIATDIDLTGKINATSGTIGGWTIGASKLSGSGVIEGGTIQNQTAAGNKVFMNSTGFHGNDSAGVERVALSTTPAKGAKAWHFYGAGGPFGGSTGLITNDTETFDSSSRAGLYIVGPAAQAVFLGEDGSVRILADNGGGVRSLGDGTQTQVRGSGSSSWETVATESQLSGKSDIGHTHGITYVKAAGLQDLKYQIVSGYVEFFLSDVYQGRVLLI